MEPVLSTREAANRLGISIVTLRDWLRKGRFPNHYHLDPEAKSSHIRIPVRDVEAIEARRRGE